MKSREFQGASDLIHRLRKLAKDAAVWFDIASKKLAPEEKMLMHDVKALCDQGDKLCFTCDEIEVLRSGLKAARGWANCVKCCRVNQACTHHKNVGTLLEEHETQNVAKLRQAMKNYCLCRRFLGKFYDWLRRISKIGFTVPISIGFSEARSDRVTKVCVCSLLPDQYVQSQCGRQSWT